MVSQAQSASAVPTDRSKVPEMMAMVMPTAATPTKLPWRSTFRKLSSVAKLGVNSAASTHTTSNTAVMPYRSHITSQSRVLVTVGFGLSQCGHACLLR